MKRVLIVLIAGVLVLAACASDDADPAGAEQSDASSSQDAARNADGTSGSGAQPGATETLPTDPNAAASNNDPATSELTEPGDPPPPADDSDSMALGDGVPPGVIYALEDLAARLGISADLIDWVSHEEVDWPDASVGCPHPDMAYAQVVTNGTLTVFEVDGIEYRYHAKAGLDPFYCDTAIMDKAAKGSIDQIDLEDLIVPTLPGTSGDESVPTESIPPPGGSDE